MTDELLPIISTCISREMTKRVREALSARFGIETVVQHGSKAVEIRLLSMEKVHHLESFRFFAEGYIGGYDDGYSNGLYDAI